MFSKKCGLMFAIGPLEERVQDVCNRLVQMIMDEL